MNAIIIARISIEEQNETGNSLEAQIAKLEQYCLSKGFGIINAYSFDETVSANDREFERIIDFILLQKEKIVICVDNVDPFSRNGFHKLLSLLYDRALADEIELHFVSEGCVITSKISASEKFTFNTKLLLANFYSDSMSKNVRMAMIQNEIMQLNVKRTKNRSQI